MADQWGMNDAIVKTPSTPDFGANDEIDQHNPLKRGWNKMKQSVGLTTDLATGDYKGAAEGVAEADTYQRQNPGSPEGKAMMQAWQRGDGITGGLEEVGKQFSKDWNAAPTGLGAVRSVAKNVQAMGSGVLEQTPNMIAPMAGQLAGGALGAVAGSKVPIVGTAIGGLAGMWAGASLGNAAVEGGGMAQEALNTAGINPQDKAATEAYLSQNGDKLLSQAGVKGGIIGAVDTLTMRLGHGLLTGPAKAASERAIKELGIDVADKEAVKAATSQIAAKVIADPVYKAATTGAGGMARNVGVAALEPAGEFAGEYAGQGVATGNWDEKNAFLEAASSIGQGAVTFAGQKLYANAKNQFGKDDPVVSQPEVSQVTPEAQPPVSQVTPPTMPSTPTAWIDELWNASEKQREDSDYYGSKLPELVSTIDGYMQSDAGWKKDRQGYEADDRTKAVDAAWATLSAPEGQATAQQRHEAAGQISDLLDDELSDFQSGMNGDAPPNDGTPPIAPPAAPKPSESMGLTPTAAPSLTNAAIVAVDSGVSQEVSQVTAQADATSAKEANLERIRKASQKPGSAQPEQQSAQALPSTAQALPEMGQPQPRTASQDATQQAQANPVIQGEPQKTVESAQSQGTEVQSLDQSSSVNRTPAQQALQATANPQPTTLGTQTNAVAGPGFGVSDVVPKQPQAKEEQGPVATNDVAKKQTIEPTASLLKTASWVIKEKATGAIIMETFDKKKVDALNTEKYEAVPIGEHLASLNNPAAQSQPTEQPLEPQAPVTQQATPKRPEAPPRPPLTDAQRQQVVDANAQDLERLFQQDLVTELKRKRGLLPAEKDDELKRSPFKTFLIRHGVSDKPADVVGEGNAFRANNIIPTLFRKDGIGMDELVNRAAEAGFITQTEADNGEGVPKLVEMIRSEVAGTKRHLPLDMQDESVEQQAAQMLRSEVEGDAKELGLPFDDDTDTKRLQGMVMRVRDRVKRAPKNGLLKPDRILKNARDAATRIEQKRAQLEAQSKAFADLNDEIQNAVLDVFVDADGNTTEFMRTTDAQAVEQWFKDNPTWNQDNDTTDASANRDSQQTGTPEPARPAEGAGRDQATGPGAQQGSAQGQGEEGLTAPTRADVLAQQAAREAEEQRKKDGGDKPIQRKVTADQVDLFNPQGSIFDAPAETAQPETKGYAKSKSFVDGVIRKWVSGETHPRHDAIEARTTISNDYLNRKITEDQRIALTAQIDAAAKEAEASGAYDKALIPGVTYRAGEQPAAQEPAKPAKIEDSGEVLEGARKLYAKSYAAKMDEGMGMDTAAVPLSKSWPEPDYQRLLDEGADPWAVAMAHAMRDEIPTKPSIAWKVKGWAGKVEILRGMAADAISGKLTRDRISTKAETHGLHGWLHKIDLYQAVGHAKSLKGITFDLHEYGMYGGQTFNPAKKLWVINVPSASGSTWKNGNWGNDLVVADTKEEAIEKFKAWHAAQGEAAPTEAKATSFDIYSYRSKPNVFIIGKRISATKSIDLKEFPTAKEARAYIAANQAELERLLSEAKFEPTERREENSPRVGADHRNGADVTSEQFRETFGFRGEQFGASMPQAERQANMNQAYDALMDLAGVIGVPPKALSLNGELGLAFGARGTGGKNAAAAHYERDTTGEVTPNRVVINLTRKNGAGSLAHEWFHAVDNYFARMRGEKGGMLTEKPYERGEGVRPEMLAAFKQLMATINLSGIKERSKQLDKKRVKDYWSTGLEMAARSFESYVIAKLQDKDGANDYLANIVPEELYAMQANYPYPVMGEMPAIRAAFDDFFKTVQTKETDKGVAMFSRGTSAAGQTERQVTSIVRAITERWSNAPQIIVATNMADPQIPQAVRDYDQKQKSLGAEGEPEGFIHGGKVYLLAEQLATPTDVMRVLFHESLGHMGLRGVFGKDLHNILRQIVTMRRKDVAAKAAQYGLDMANMNEALQAAEEVLAEMSQSKPDLGFVTRAIAAIRAFLRKNVPGFMGMKMTDADIVAQFILPARRFVEGNGGSNGGKKAQQSGTIASQMAFGRGTNDPMTNTNVVGNQGGRSADDSIPGDLMRKLEGTQVVDSSGNPLLVYHGSKTAIDGFDTRKTVDGGLHFGSKSQASMRSSKNLHPAYLYAENLRRSKDTGSNWKGKIASAKAAGYDGIVYLNRYEGVSKETAIRLHSQGLSEKLDRMSDSEFRQAVPEAQDSYIVFDAKQVIQPNESTAPDSGGATRFSRTVGRNSWDAPEPSKFDDLVYKLQDKQIDTKRVIESIKLNGTLTDDKNVYLQEELFHGRAAARTEDFVNKELSPLVNMMKIRGLDIAALDEYLHARHAEEANKLIAERNPEIPDGGSGMTTQAARDYLAKLTPAEKTKLEAVAAKVDSILATTRQMYADYDLESQEKVDGWGEMFKHYVPLMREDKDGGIGIGQGFSIKGKEVKGRTGSTRKVVDILANIALQRERAIVRGEKNRVATALVGLVKANPNKDFWHVGPPPAQKVYDPDSNSVVERTDPLYKSRENVLVAKIKGKNGQVTEQAVTFSEDDPRAVRMAAALKNLDAAQLEGLLGVSAKITRYFAAINTQYNPIFGTVNLVRDVQGALFNLTTTPLKGQTKAIAGDTLSALKGIYLDARAARDGKTPASKWAKLWEEFQDEGGQTGFRDLFANSADRAKAIERELNPTAWMDSPLGKVFTADGTLKVPLTVAQKKATGVFDWLSDYNLAMENAVRLASYKAGIDQGMSKQQAASIAKNLTVNFNRKGQVGQQAGALYAFFNASMQGTARLGQTLFTMEPGKPKTIRLSATGKKIVYGGVLLGVAQAVLLSASGFDDEEPPDFVRERSMIIPTGGKTYITIPMPLGLHVLPNMGRIPAEFVMGGFKDPAKHIAKMLGLFAGTFNPIGGGDSLVQMLSPTAIDPIVAIAENKDWTGKPIAKVSFNKAIPGHQLAKDTASSPAKWLSEAINFISGGTEYTAGILSPTPDQIDYLWGQATGGVGREVSKVNQTVSSVLSGEELPPHKMPLVGRFYGNADAQSSQSNQFYANINRLNEHEAEIKGRRKDGDAAGATQYLRDNPDARLFMAGNKAERDVQKLRALKRELVAKGADKAQVTEIEDRINARTAQFNELVKAYALKQAA